MDQEAEAMKTKKILWPWAERQIKGKKKTSGQPVFGSANMVQDNTGNEVFDNTEIPYDSRPIEISEWFHTFTSSRRNSQDNTQWNGFFRHYLIHIEIPANTFHIASVLISVPADTINRIIVMSKHEHFMLRKLLKHI